jgi:hypothetical protein
MVPYHIKTISYWTSRKYPDLCRVNTVTYGIAGPSKKSEADHIADISREKMDERKKA